MTRVPINSSSRTGTTQTIAFDSTTPITNAFGAQTYQIRLMTNAACHYHIYDSTGSATATTADPILPAIWVEYVTVTPGQKISALKAVAAGVVLSSAGTLWVTELA